MEARDERHGEVGRINEVVDVIVLVRRLVKDLCDGVDTRVENGLGVVVVC